MREIHGTAVFESTKYKTIKELVTTSCDKYAEMDAFLFRRNPKDNEVHITYSKFGEDVKALSTYLLNSPYVGDKCSVVGANCYEWYLTNISILSTSSVSVPLDRMLPEAELTELLVRAQSKIIFYHPKHHEMMMSIREKQKNGRSDIAIEKFILMYDELGKKDVWPEEDCFVHLEDWLAKGRELIESGDDKFDKVEIDPDDVKIILFTSGTTSQSKGVMLSHDNICSNVYSITATLDVRPGDRGYIILPLHHTFENTIDYFFLTRGVCLCQSDGLRYISKNLEEWHPEVCISVPLLFENIYSKIEAGIAESGKQRLISVMVPVTKFLRKIGIDIRRNIFKEIIDKLGGHMRLVVIGGAGIDKRYIDAFTNFGVDFFMGYGLTETSPVISTTSTACNVHGSVGRPMFGITAAIDTEEKKKNAVGEIITKSPCVMKGYYKNPEATAEVIDENGWLHTGDMGYIDKTGSIHITGRVKSMIVLTSGKKAFPEEIESLICEIKGVNEAFVWGGKNERQAIDICAKLLINRAEIGRELGLNVEPEDSQVTAYLNDKMHEVNHKMPSYRIVRNYVFSEKDMIKTTTLKIRRPLEQKAIEDLLAAGKTDMREMDGCNIDKIIIG